jgi:hypothetical protein
MNSSINYPVFTYNNQSIVLLPGSRFTKNELTSRLHQMNIDTNNIQNKNTLVNLYESSLQRNENKLKIFDRLRKDTELLNSKLGMSGRQSIQASNMNTMSNNSKTKIINISADVKPFSPDNNNNNNNNISNNNSIKQINLQSRVNTAEVPHNPLMSQNSQSNQTAQFGYRNNEKNSYNDNYLNSRNFQNNNNLNNNKIYTNDGNSYNNYNQKQKQYYDNTNNSILNKSNMNNNMNNSNMYRNREINNINNSNKYIEDINTDINMSNNNRYPNQDNSYRNSNRNNYSMQQSQSQYQDNNNPMLRSGNNTNNNTNNSNNFNSMNQTNYTSNYTPNYLDSQTRMIMEPGEGQRQPMLQEQITDNRPYKREPDEESNLSLFSTFKNSPLYKNRREICINVSIAFIVICFAIGALSLIVKFWDAIMDVLMNPRRLFVDGIFGFISSLFFGSIRYFYITIPLILLIIFLILYFRRYRVKKICEEILKKIRDDLMNGPNIIYQDDFYKKYAESYGISEKEFREKYLPVLKRMRRRQDLNMKIAEEMTDNGKTVSYWFLNN